MDILISGQIYIKKGLDISGCEDFWVSIINENGINMIQNSKIKPRKITYTNKIDLNKSFVSLLEFLYNSRYVGRYFKRTTPKYNDMSYIKEEKTSLVLYARDDLMLIKHQNFLGEEKYQMLSPRYFEDGEFQFYGEYNKDYIDKQFLYKEINDQIINSNRGKIR